MSFLIRLVNSRKIHAKEKEYKSNSIILHQFPRSLRAPSASPFCLKLETWLRMAKLDYVNDLDYTTSPKGKMPWISVVSEKGEIANISDSQFCIEFLSKKFKINLNKNLSMRDEAIAHSLLKMCEESLYWVLLLHRYIYSRNYEESGVPNLIAYLYSGTIQKGCYFQGYGRHTKEEVYEIGKKDLKAINDLIGNENKFLFGNDVCDADAALFGTLSQFMHHCYGPLNDYLINECPNCLRLINNIKNEYWKDWNECLKTLVKK